MFGGTDGNVIEMGEFINTPKFRALREVEAYWEGLRRDGRVPKRSDIDPRGIENALEYAFILEKIAPGLARLRIAGMHLCDLMGMEVRGMPISSFIPPAGRKAFAETLEEVTTRPAVARLTLQAEAGIGRPALTAQMVLLPMMSDFGDVSRILGAFEADGKIGRAPRRFDVVETEIRSLDSVAQPIPASRETVRKGSEGETPSTRREARETAEELRARLTDRIRNTPGFEEPAAPFTRKGGKKRPSYLRLIKSNDGPTDN